MCTLRRILFLVLAASSFLHVAAAEDSLTPQFLRVSDQNAKDQAALVDALVIEKSGSVDTDCSHYRLSVNQPGHPLEDASTLLATKDGRGVACWQSNKIPEWIIFPFRDAMCPSPGNIYTVRYTGPAGGTGQIELKYSVVSSDALKLRTQLKITPSVCLGKVEAKDITVEQEEKIIGKDGTLELVTPPRSYPVKEEPQHRGDSLIVNLDSPLPDARTTTVKITIKTKNGSEPIIATGSVTVPDAPTSDNDAKLIVNLSGTSAVDSGPVYSGSGTLALLHPPDRSTRVPKHTFAAAYLDPSATFDLGSKSSGSANSISGTVPLKWEYAPPRNTSKRNAAQEASQRKSGDSATTSEPEPKVRSTGIAREVEARSGANQNKKTAESPDLSIVGVCNGGVSTSKSWGVGLRPHTYLFSAGPKAEIGTVIGAEQVLNRETLLFEGTVEAHPCLLDWSRANKQALYAASLSDADYKLLRAPAFGFQLTPYFTFDGGSSLFDQTVSDKATSTSVTVPSQGIARVYFGFRGEWEFPLWKFPSSITFDETGFYLAKTEQIAFDDAKGAQIRSVSGLQPHSSLGLNLYFGQSQHYALTISYEDGRSAPSFEYLNKVQYGVKIKF